MIEIGHVKKGPTSAMVELVVWVEAKDGSYVSNLVAGCAAEDAIQELRDHTLTISDLPDYPDVVVHIRNPG